MTTPQIPPRPQPQLQASCAAFASAALVLAAAAWALLRFVVPEPGVEQLPAPWPGLLVAAAALALVAAPLVEGRLARAAVGAAGGAETAGARAKIVGFALRGSVALCGFALALATGRLAWSLTLSTAALVAMALAWPRGDEAEPR